MPIVTVPVEGASRWSEARGLRGPNLSQRRPYPSVPGLPGRNSQPTALHRYSLALKLSTDPIRDPMRESWAWLTCHNFKSSCRNDNVYSIRGSGCMVWTGVDSPNTNPSRDLENSIEP